MSPWKTKKREYLITATCLKCRWEWSSRILFHINDKTKRITGWITRDIINLVALKMQINFMSISWHISGQCDTIFSSEYEFLFKTFQLFKCHLFYNCGNLLLYRDKAEGKISPYTRIRRDGDDGGNVCPHPVYAPCPVRLLCPFKSLLLHFEKRGGELDWNVSPIDLKVTGQLNLKKVF